MNIIIATNNSNKLLEIQEKFSSLKDIVILPLSSAGEIPEIKETGSTFKENALIKAREIAKRVNCAVLSDDSGLVIDALGGEPGVFSARYHGLSNDNEKNILVLEKMKSVPEGSRSARFVCVMALILPDGSEQVVEGTCEGSISFAPVGGSGFGYDPIFFIPEKGKTMAEISLEEKNKISHRAKALEKIFRILEKT